MRIGYPTSVVCPFTRRSISPVIWNSWPNIKGLSVCVRGYTMRFVILQCDNIGFRSIVTRTDWEATVPIELAIAIVSAIVALTAAAA